MKAHYGLLLAMLLGSGQLIAAEQANDEDTRPSISEEQEQDVSVEQKQDISGEQGQAGEAQTATMEQTGFSSGSVMRSAFTTRIDNREPVDDVEKVDNETREVFYFTELRDMEGQTAKHRWEYQGEVMAEVEFNVKGPRWRVWSSKRFVPDWTGEWSVSVVNAANEVIAEDKLQYVEGSEVNSVDDQGVESDAADDMDTQNTAPGMQ